MMNSGVYDYENENNDNMMMIDNEEDEEEITQEDGWPVICAYLEENGLVRQQLDSFDAFIQSMQEIVDEFADIEVRSESQHKPGHQSDFDEARRRVLVICVEACGVGPRSDVNDGMGFDANHGFCTSDSYSFCDGHKEMEVDSDLNVWTKHITSSVSH